MLHDGSYGNADATGIFGENKVFMKWKKAFHDLKETNIHRIWKDLVKTKSRWMVGHNRLATQGSEDLKKNNHPIRNEVCTVVHNGVLSNDDALKRDFALNYNEQTDSAIIPFLIDHYFDDKTDEVSAIESAMEQITGSYSVFVYMHKSKRLFYLKNTSTSFSFLRAETRDGVSIYGSTREARLKDIGTSKANGVFAVNNLISRSIFEPKTGKIYEINAEKMSLDKVGEFKPRISTGSVTYYGNHQYNNSGYGSRWDWEEQVSGVPSKKHQKRLDKKEVRHLLSEAETDILEVWNEFLTDFDYTSGLYHEDVNVDKLLADAEIQFNDASQTVVIRKVPETLAEQFEIYANARSWTDYDNSEKGLCNVTLMYKEVIDFVQNTITNTR